MLEASERQKDRTDKAFAKWKEDSSDIRSRLGLPRETKDWTSRPDVHLRGVPDRPRLYDLLNIGFGIKLLENTGNEVLTRQMMKDYYCDLSSSVARLPFKTGQPHTFRQNSYEYNYGFDTVLSGTARMQLLGWPRSMLPRTFDDSVYRKLSGEGYSVPICSVLNYLAYTNPWAPWWRGE